MGMPLSYRVPTHEQRFTWQRKRLKRQHSHINNTALSFTSYGHNELLIPSYLHAIIKSSTLACLRPLMTFFYIIDSWAAQFVASAFHARSLQPMHAQLVLAKWLMKLRRHKMWSQLTTLYLARSCAKKYHAPLSTKMSKYDMCWVCFPLNKSEPIHFFSLLAVCRIWWH